MFKGSIVALITPFRDGRVDEKAFQALCEWQIAEGSAGLVPCGTTGETPTLSHEEHKRVIDLCVEVAGKRVPVIAGTGSNSTMEAVELSDYARKAGVDAVLIQMPYYNRPTQEGLYAHCKTIHDSVDIPIVLYNVPSRSAVDLSQDTLAKLGKLPRIVGIKDATGNIARISSTRLLLGDKFSQLSGEDATALAVLAHGGHGCISVTANVAPRLCADMQDAWFAGKPQECLAIQDRLMPLHTALFLETNPSPVKYAASLLDLCTDDVRLPLVGLKPETKEKVRTAMVSAGLLN